VNFDIHKLMSLQATREEIFQAVNIKDFATRKEELRVHLSFS